MTKRLQVFFVLSSILSFTFITTQAQIEIQDMRWGADFNIHIKFSNDSTSIMDVQGLYHASGNGENMNNGEVTYYPVTLDKQFISALKNKEIESFVGADSLTQTRQAGKSKTLWSAIHTDIGGGWIHFINCLVYAIESGQVNITAPLMKRPDSNWKPKPMTESYKRTRNWDYYVPTTQKLAHKEYKIKAAKNELGNINLLPPTFIQLFLETSDKDYNQLLKDKSINQVAIIDMVRLLLGANYLGQEQIDYLQNSVLTSVTRYSVNSLPSVIIFDDFQAAVAMTLDNSGYKIDRIVFNNETELTSDEVSQRIERMNGIIAKINEVNKKVFEQKLKSYYN